MDPGHNASLILDRNLESGRGDKPAVVDPDDRVYTYRDLHLATCAVASFLRSLGVRREERILMVMDDSAAFPATFLGAIRIGAVPIPVNFLLRADDFAYFLDDSYAVALVCDQAFLPTLLPEVEKRPQVRLVVSRGEAPPGAESLDRVLEEGSDEVPPVPTHPDDPAFWLYSSGSTGRPKGVVHLQSNIAYTCENYAVPILGIGEDDVCFSTTKLFHAYGLGNGLSFPFWVGATAVQLGGRPTPDRILDRIERHSPTLFFSVPTLYNALTRHPDFASRNLSSIRLGVSAAEALPAEVWNRWFEATGVEILDGVGSTEMLHIYCSNRRGEVRPGSSGKPVPGYEIELRGEDGTPVEDGGAGDLWVKGGSAFAYYWHQREKTRGSFAGGWFHSGDRYRRDEDGYYWYEGRSDDMIKVGGLWVSPIEIENRLVEHPAVAEAAVVGVKEEGLTRIKAYVILAAGHQGSDELTATLQAWCKEKLLRYQYPHMVEFVDDLPRTATGKIQRFKLRQ
jgi:benzoate-CoA ligase